MRNSGLTLSGWTPIDLKLSLGLSLGFAAIVMWGSPAIDAACVILLLVSLLGSAHFALAIVLCMLVRILNPTLAMPSENANLIFWLTLLLGLIRNYPQIVGAKYVKQIWPIWVLVFWALISSLITSPYIYISLLKLLSFTIGTTLLIAIFQSISEKSYLKFSRQLVTIYVFVALVSMPLIFIPKIGFALNQEGFQGILNQPQTLGIFLAPPLAFLLTRIFETRKLEIPPLLACVALLIEIYETGARTALLATLLSCGIAALIGLTRNTKYKVKISITKLFLTASLTIAALGTAFTYSEPFRENVYKFIFKREETKSINVAFLESRGALVQEQLERFKESPIVGNGFGIYAGKNPTKRAANTNGLLLSAPVEKGFIFTAVLEEMGIVGAIFFTFSISYLIWQASRAYSVAFVAMFLACLLVNFGEAVFFSLGGIGIYFWVLIAYILGTMRRAKRYNTLTVQDTTLCAHLPQHTSMSQSSRNTPTL